MNVRDLKAGIEDLPDDMEVILQRDSEGNGFSPLAGIDEECIYTATTPYSGEVYPSEMEVEDIPMDADEWEEMLKKPRVLVLFPTL